MKAPTKKSTLLFLIDGNNILLAMKKRGFGAGRWNGVGGKPEKDELIEQAAIRECQEEINVTPTIVKQVATLNFYFPSDKSDWNQQVIVYLCTEWEGEPSETEEMRPQWHDVKDIPYELTWTDDKYWLPKVLEGNYVEAEFSLDDNDGVLDYTVNTKKLA